MSGRGFALVIRCSLALRKRNHEQATADIIKPASLCFDNCLQTLALSSSLPHLPSPPRLTSIGLPVKNNQPADLPLTSFCNTTFTFATVTSVAFPSSILSGFA